MKHLKNFVTSHMFSGIPGIQKEALDTYEVTQTENGVTISYSCECKEKPTVKESVTVPIPFSRAIDLALFLSENACRKNGWIDVLNDFISQNRNISH